MVVVVYNADCFLVFSLDIRKASYHVLYPVSRRIFGYICQISSIRPDIRIICRIMDIQYSVGYLVSFPGYPTRFAT